MNTQFGANVADDNVILIKSSDLQNDFLDLMDLSLIPNWSGELHL